MRTAGPTIRAPLPSVTIPASDRTPATVDSIASFVEIATMPSSPSSSFSVASTALVASRLSAARFPAPRSAVSFLLLLAASASATAADIELRIMETTDLHMYALPFDYYQDREDAGVGLARTATLIDQARGEVENSLLFDNGDLIQGNPMGDYMARARGLAMGEVHPIYKAMNLIGYDAANIGNHEFNYGLEFLLKSLAGADFPYVLANVYEADGDDDPANDRHYFRPYVLLEREFVDTSGASHALTVGVIGFTPPQIMQWDKGHLAGRVTVRGIVETAETLVPIVRDAGADLVVAIPHSGIATSHPDGLKENATAELSKVPGIDAILFGHAHSVFPSEAYEGFPGADLEAGTLNGVPSVMPGFWGSHLGVIDLTLTKGDGDDAWTVASGGSEVRSIYRLEERDKIAVVESREDVVAAVRVRARRDARMGRAGGRTGHGADQQLLRPRPGRPVDPDRHRRATPLRRARDRGHRVRRPAGALRRRAVQGGRARRSRQLHRTSPPARSRSGTSPTSTSTRTPSAS